MGGRTARKHPLGYLAPHGLTNATTDPATIDRWWRRAPDANVGIATGEVSGIVVIDLDHRHGGEESLAALVAEHGPLPETVESISGSGGRHILFAHPGVPVKNTESDIAPDGGTRPSGT